MAPSPIIRISIFPSPLANVVILLEQSLRLAYVFLCLLYRGCLLAVLGFRLVCRRSKLA